MGDNLQIRTDAAKLLKDFAKLPKDLQAAVQKGIRRGLLIAETRVQQKSDTKSRRGGAGLFGRLTSGAVKTDQMGVDGVIGFRKTKGFPYELSQEYGAKAKPGGAMAIPVTKEAMKVDSPRDFPGILFIPSGTHVLAAAENGVVFITHYILVKSIKPRLNFRKTVAGSMGIIGDEIMAEASGIG